MSHGPAAPAPAHVSRVPRTLLDRVAQWWRTSTLTLWAVAGAAGLFQLMVLNVASYTYPHLPLRGWVIVALLLAASLVARRRWPLAVVALGMWVILTFVTWLGTIMRSFATTMTTVLLSTIAGMAMLLVARPLSVLNPAASLTRTTSAMSPGYVTSLGAAAFEGVICLVWVVFLALALRRAVRRQS